MMIGFVVDIRKGEYDGSDLGGTTLHTRKRGMKTIRKRERVTSRDAAQTCSTGKLQRYRPTQSPKLNTRKCIALKMNGLESNPVSCTDRIVDVIAGNRDWRSEVSLSQLQKVSRAHECHKEIEEDREVVCKVLPRDLRLKRGFRT